MVNTLKLWFAALFFSGFLSLHCVEVHAITAKYVELQEFRKILDDKKQVTFVFIFTAWCNACKGAFAEVLDMQAQHDKEKVNVLMVSLDEDPSLLEAFLMKYSKYDGRVYHFSAADVLGGHVSKLLADSGIQYGGTIPHTTIFYDGAVVADASYEINSIDRFIKHLLQDGFDKSN